MGDDTRVTSAASRLVSTPEDDGCDDATKTCGETMSRGKPHEDAPLVTQQQKPADVARVAANMRESAFRAEYTKMSTPELDAAVRTLSNRLTAGTSYAGHEEDSARFAAAESVMSQRNVTDPPKGPTNEQLTAAKAREDAKQQDAEAWRTPLHPSEQGSGVVLEVKKHKDANVTVLDARVEVSTATVGPQITGLHAETTKHAGGVDFTGSADVGTANFGPGFHNKDGSLGLHLGGSGTSVGVEGTAHKQGLGSITVGVSDGPAAEASIGGKKEGSTYEVCGRVSLEFFTVGACIPVWRM